MEEEEKFITADELNSENDGSIVYDAPKDVVEKIEVEKDPSILDKNYGDEGEDYREMMNCLKQCYLEDKNKWTNLVKEIKGVSEETTTGPERSRRLLVELSDDGDQSLEVLVALAQLHEERGEFLERCTSRLF